MPIVNAYGKRINFPDDMSHEEIANVISANEKDLNPDYKAPESGGVRSFIENNILGFSTKEKPSIADQAEASADEGANTAAPQVKGAPVRQSFYNKALLDSTIGVPVTERFRKPDREGVMARIRNAADEDIKGQSQQRELEGLRTDENVPEGGFVASAKTMTGQTIKGAGQLGADYFGADKDNALIKYGDEIIRENPGVIKTLQDIKDQPFMAFKEASGNMVPSFGAMLGTAVLGQGIISVAPLTGPLAPVVAAVGAGVKWLGPAAIAALPSYGSIRDKQIFNDKANEDSEKAKAIALLGASAVGAIEVAFGPQNWAISMMTKEGRAALARKFAATTPWDAFMKGGLLGGASEGAEELVQNPIEQLSSFENPLTKKNIEETKFGGAMGFIGGFAPGGITNTANYISQQAQIKADRINAERAKLGLDKIVKSTTVDEAINAANESVSQKPVDKEDVLRVVDPTLADIERLTGLKPSESIQEAERQQSILSQAQQENNATQSDIEGQNNRKPKTPRDTEIVLPDNKALNAQWDIVDADNVKASLKNGESQPRDRTRAASDLQIQSIAKNPDYRRLSDSPVMDIGAPVLSNDGQIVGGNGRFEAISRAYDQGSYQEYLDNLKEDAIRKGIDPAAIDRMKKPVLVRRITQQFDTRQLAIASNSGMSAQYSDLEQARLDSERLKGLEDILTTDNGDIALTADNIRRVRDALGNYSPAEIAPFVDANGQLSQQGMKRIRNAMLAKAYGDNPVIQGLIESNDSDVRNILGALTRVVGDVIKAKANAPKESDITPSVLEAVNIYSQLRQQNRPVSSYLQQQDAFAERAKPAIENILMFLDKNSRSQPKLTEFFRDAYTKLGSIDTKTADIFGQEVKPKPEDLFEKPKELLQPSATLKKDSSWIIKNKKTGEILFETFDKDKVDNLNTNKYEAIPAIKYLQGINTDIKGETVAKELQDHLKKNGYEFDVNPVTEREFNALSESKKAQKELAEKQAKIFGKKVVFVKTKGKFGINGVMVPAIKDTIFIDLNTPKPFHAVMAHELSHWMEQENPKAYKDMLGALKDIIINEEGYRRKYNIDDQTEGLIPREIAGDLMGDNFTKPEFWKKVAEYNPSKFKEIAQNIIKWLKNIILKAKARGMGSEEWVTDAKKAQDIIANAVSQYTKEQDAVGEKIEFKKKSEGDLKLSKEKQELEDYRMEHQSPGREGNAPLSDLTGDGNIYPDDVYSSKAVQYYGTGDDVMDRQSFNKAKLYRGKPNAMVDIYRAVPKGVSDKINPGDWVTINKNYAKEHGESYFDGKYDILTKKVKAGDIFTNGDSIHEWGYEPEDNVKLSKQQKLPETINIDGTERPTRNSEGKLIHPTEEGIRKFWKWFGNSVVVDDQGRPLVVYHGGNGLKIDFSRGSSRGGIGLAYFTVDKRVAWRYALGGGIDNSMSLADYRRKQLRHAPNRAPTVSSVYLSIDNIVDLDKLSFKEIINAIGRDKFFSTMEDWAGADYSSIEDAFYADKEYEGLHKGVSFKEYFEENFEELINFDESFSHEDTDSLINTTDASKFIVSSGLLGEFLERSGHNGIVYKDNESKSTVYVAQHPSQIKSAIGNNGEFSEDNNDIRFSFAGENSETANKYQLSTAQQMLNAGIGSEAVRQETGWFKGADGKWRYEINDRDAKLSDWFVKDLDNGKTELRNKLLPGVLWHDKLYAAYPSLREIRVDWEKSNRIYGKFDVNENKITVRAATAREIKSVLLHEIQHGIQKIEGFATGGSPDKTGMLGPENSIQALETKRKIDIAHAINREKAESYLLSKNKEINDFVDFAYEKWTKRLGEKTEKNPYGVDKLKAVEFEIAERDEALESLLKLYNKQVYLSSLSPLEIYRRLYGEIESRNVQARINMDDEERSLMPPYTTQDIPDRDAIVMFNGNIMENAPTPKNAKPFNPNEDIPETKAQKAQRIGQDKFNRFRVIKEWLAKERGINLSEAADVYGAEERYYGKVANQQEDFREKVRNPLIEKISKAGYKLDDVEQYLLNRHAQEANAQNRKLTGKEDSTAYGISDADAQAYLDKAPKELAKLADEVQALTDKAQQLRLDNGIETDERVNAMKGAYQYYVPVRGDAESQQKQNQYKGTGKGFSMKYKPKRRLGHELRNESVIENIFQDYERAIIQVEKNRVFKSLALMAAEIKMPELISIDQPVKRKILRTDTAFTVEHDGEIRGVFHTMPEAQMFKKVLEGGLFEGKPSSNITINKTQDQRLIYSASPMLADNEVVGYMNGHEIRLQVNDELLARAYKNMGTEALGNILSTGRAINGWMSKAYTGYNPEFLPVNIQRDFTTGVINLTGEQGILISAKAVANYPKSFSSLLKYAANGKSDKWIDAYRDNGGNTGAAYLPDLERLGEEVKREYASYQGVIANLKEGDSANALRAAGRKAFNATLKYINHLNSAGENAFRLATFKAMIDSGKSVNEAASMAKNVTVNFNRKGEMGAELNALYLFFNASLQGTAATSHALFKGRHKYQAWGLSGAMMAVGYMMASMLGGFDDEDKYDEISDATKSRNLIMAYGDGYVKIPVPYGYGFFYNAGRMYAEAQRKGELGKMPYQLMALATEEFSPFNVATTEDSEFSSKKVFYGFLPTMLKIPSEITNNYSSFANRELYPEKTWYKSEPDNEKMWRGTKGTVYDISAQYLASIGIEISPETLKYMARTATGGSGAFVDSAVSGAMLKSQGAELEAREIPFARKFYGENTIQDARARYGKVKEEARIAFEKFNALRKKNDIESVRKFIDDKKELLALNSYANKLSDVIKNIRDQQDLIKLSDKYTTAEKRLKIKELENQEKKYYDMFMKQYKTVKH